MAKVYLSEYQNISLTTNGLAQCASEPALATQVLDTTATHLSAAFNTNTRYIRLNADGVVSYKISTAGTAAGTSDARLAANTSEYFGIKAGDKIDVIANT